MSDLLKMAEANVQRFSRALTASLEPHVGHRDCPAIVANIEGLIISHIQKTIAQSMGDLK